MALRVRFQYTSGASLGFSVERLVDGLYYDFADGTFKASTTTPVSALSAGTGNFQGAYLGQVSSTPIAQFPNGDYAVGVHDLSVGNTLIAYLGATLYGGDDAPVFPAPTAPDPWSVALPGAYAAGSAGAILGGNLDTKVSTRSTYAGGPIEAVVAPVTVGTNLDKSGYALAVAPPSVGQIVSGVWDEPRASHGAAGSFGAQLDAAVSSRLSGQAYTAPPSVATIAAAVWDEPRAAHGASGSFGALLDAPVSTRLAAEAYAPSVSAQAIAAAVWTDASPSNFATPGSAGERLLQAGASNDPWNVALTGSYAPGTAGAILATNLDVPVSSRSTYAGGPVEAVYGAVTVGTNLDKSGYLLAATGLDAVAVEPGVNARQALVPILAAAAGTISGAGSGTVVVRGADSSVTRIMATTDTAGNRSSVVLMLPD